MTPLRSTRGRWGRLLGLPAVAVLAVGLVGAPAFAATSDHGAPLPPPKCVIKGGGPGQGGGTIAVPDNGKPGKKCVICIVHKQPGAADSGATTGVGTPVACPVCKISVTGPGQGTGPVTLPAPGGPDKKCVICIVIKGGGPAPSTEQKPVPGKPGKCVIILNPSHPVTK